MLHPPGQVPLNVPFKGLRNASWPPVGLLRSARHHDDGHRLEPAAYRLPSQAPPDTAEVAADLVFSLNRSAIWACCRGEPAVMIGRPPPPAAPKSGPRCDRLSHPK